MKAKVAIIILSVSTSILLATTIIFSILTAVNAGEKGALQAKYDKETAKLEDRIYNVALVTCLLEGYNYTKLARVNECKSLASFVIEQKTDEDIKNLLDPYNLYKSNNT